VGVSEHRRFERKGPEVISRGDMIRKCNEMYRVDSGIYFMGCFLSSVGEQERQIEPS